MARPGVIRLSLPFHMPRVEAEFVLGAVEWVASHAKELLQMYAPTRAGLWLVRDHVRVYQLMPRSGHDGMVAMAGLDGGTNGVEEGEEKEEEGGAPVGQALLGLPSALSMIRGVPPATAEGPGASGDMAIVDGVGADAMGAAGAVKSMLAQSLHKNVDWAEYLRQCLHMADCVAARCSADHVDDGADEGESLLGEHVTKIGRWYANGNEL